LAASARVGKEIEAGRTADEDVRGVADERGRAADVTGDDLRDEEWSRVELQVRADGDRHRGDQEDRRHVIEEG
jgi:hypothetical protein